MQKNTTSHTPSFRLNYLVLLSLCSICFTSFAEQTDTKQRYQLNEHGDLIRTPEQIATRKANMAAAKLLPVAPVAFPSDKQLIDFFLPIPRQSKNQPGRLWGSDAVQMRDPANGLESSAPDYCYWDGQIVKADDGKYHMYASRWDQSYPHGKGWKVGSKAIHAVSDKAIGPYKDTGLAWPYWQDGKGHNVIGLRLKDGRYAIVSSEITPGNVFVSDKPDGPWDYLGEIQTAATKLNDTEAATGLARYPWNGFMSNVMIRIRHDGRYMITPRSTAPLISESGVLGPYTIAGTRAYAEIEGFPQHFVEDPTLWYSGGMYHMVVNHHPTNRSYHLTSENGIDGWKNRGIAFTKDQDIFKYDDGTVVKWRVIQRPTAYLENGTVSHFLFSVIDVGKGQDRGNDKHCSKIVVVPFDGKAFDKYMQSLIEKEKQQNTKSTLD
ncbi:glycoside hydrolase family protein [Agaribacter flavus]|uniref:Glycoside hydrolase family protein n=1 Tax=Agaribacter flavus TaxID=1902781 RepID=A0ABV7FW53_9ALTE